jgi:site-specific DNA-methyltransferase (adenine-specific)
MEIQPNILFKADCLELLERLNTEAIDLVYLDPPPLATSGTLCGSPERAPDDQVDQQLRLISKVCQHVHRVLKRTGVVFFHATPSSAFRIRLILNQIFGEQYFRGEIVWQHRRVQHRNTVASEHDSILLFSKSEQSTENRVLRPLAFPRDLADRLAFVPDAGDT